MTKKHIQHIFNLAAIIFGLNSLNSSLDAMELVVGKEDTSHKQNDREIELKPRVISPYQDISALLNASKITEFDELDFKTGIIIEYMQVINALLKYKKALEWENPGFTYCIHEEQERVFRFLDKHQVLMNKYEEHKINKIDLFLDLEIPIISRKTITTLLQDKNKKTILKQRLKELEKNKKTIKKLVKKIIPDLNEKYTEYRTEYSKFSLNNKEAYAQLSDEYADYHKEYGRLLKDAKDQDYMFEKYVPELSEKAKTNIKKNYEAKNDKEYTKFSDKYPKLEPQEQKDYYQFLKLKSTQQKYERVQRAVEQYNDMYPGLENNPFEDNGCFSWNTCFGCFCG